VYDGEWQVNGTTARIWAQSEDGTKKWDTFKDEEVKLVPETEYEADTPQILNFKIQ